MSEKIDYVGVIADLKKDISQIDLSLTRSYECNDKLRATLAIVESQRDSSMLMLEGEQKRCIDWQEVVRSQGRSLELAMEVQATIFRKLEEVENG